MVDEREVLELLSSAARAGSVAAMKEMRVYWRERPEPDRAGGSPGSSYPPDWRSQVEKRQRRAMPQYLRPRRGESGSPSRSLSSSVSTSPRDSDWLWATLCQRALSARQLPATSMSARGKQRSSLTI
jgi:hypothetical protein